MTHRHSLYTAIIVIPNFILHFFVGANLISSICYGIPRLVHLLPPPLCRSVLSPQGHSSPFSFTQPHRHRLFTPPEKTNIRRDSRKDPANFIDKSLIMAKYKKTQRFLDIESFLLVEFIKFDILFFSGWGSVDRVYSMGITELCFRVLLIMLFDSSQAGPFFSVAFVGS